MHFITAHSKKASDNIKELLYTCVGELCETLKKKMWSVYFIWSKQHTPTLTKSLNFKKVYETLPQCPLPKLIICFPRFNEWNSKEDELDNENN